MQKTLRERFEEKIEMIPECGCWISTFPDDGYGYARISINGKLKRVHRVAWELYNGPIPSDMCVCHKCDVRCCVNPQHLYLGTNADNNRDRMLKKRSASKKGLNNGRAVLSHEDIMKIREDKRPQRKIAKDYHISHIQVGRIKNRKQWRHI